MPTIPTPVVINQCRYRSIHDAARATGYSEATIRRRMRQAESIYLTENDFANVKPRPVVGTTRVFRRASSESSTVFSWELVYRLLSSPTPDLVKSQALPP